MEVTKLETITIPTLIKLLVIRMIAKSSLGLSNKYEINSNFLDLESLFKVWISFGPNEKNATSDPEINAENSKRISKIRIENINGTISVSKSIYVNDLCVKYKN